MARKHTSIQLIKTLVLFTLVLFVAAGCPKTSETTTADQDNADVQTPVEDSGDGDIVLAEHGIRLGMTIPEDGRTLVGVIDLSALPAEGIRFGAVSEDQPEGCICICHGDDCQPSPPGCPANCPVPLCPGGYLPPCPDATEELPDLRALLAETMRP